MPLVHPAWPSRAPFPRRLARPAHFDNTSRPRRGRPVPRRVPTAVQDIRIPTLCLAVRVPAPAPFERGARRFPDLFLTAPPAPVRNMPWRAAAFPEFREGPEETFRAHRPD